VDALEIVHVRSVGLASFRCVATVLCPCRSVLGRVTRGRSLLSSSISAPHRAAVSRSVHWTATDHCGAVFSRRFCTLAQHRCWPAGTTTAAHATQHHRSRAYAPRPRSARVGASCQPHHGHSGLGQPAGPPRFSSSLLCSWVNRAVSSVACNTGPLHEIVSTGGELGHRATH
jgi:hypothetical protein